MRERLAGGFARVLAIGRAHENLDIFGLDKEPMVHRTREIALAVGEAIIAALWLIELDTTPVSGLEMDGTIVFQDSAAAARDGHAAADVGSAYH